VADNVPADASRIPLMAGNWKMNLNHFEAIAHVQKLAFSLADKDYAAVEVAVLPPFTDLRSVQTLVDGDKLKIKYGAQDVSQHASGAYTGDVSAAMLAKLGCAYVVVGHSERRQYHGESDELVAAKAKAALGSGVAPIVCVGEGLEVRKAGGHVEHTLAQLDGSLADLTAKQVERTVIAYEPVWAIGTGEVATPQDAQEVIGAIRGRLAESQGAEVAAKVRILYGGSVKGSNAAGIMAQPDIDGALIGGASLDPEDFVRIVRYLDQAVNS
jgi:triosephosphate isomerase